MWLLFFSLAGLAVGNPTARVPYVSLLKRKIMVHGLLEGLSPLRTPSAYSKRDLLRILRVSSGIHFSGMCKIASLLHEVDFEPVSSSSRSAFGDNLRNNRSVKLIMLLIQLWGHAAW